MAVLAERHGGRVDRVAAAHSLRVLLVVVLIPFGFQAAGIHGIDPALPALQEVRPLGPGAAAGGQRRRHGAAVRCCARPTPGCWARWRRRWRSPPPASSCRRCPRRPATPGSCSSASRWARRFTPDFARAAPRWLAAVAAGTLAMIAASAGFAWLLAQLAGLHPATVLLATSPGGIAEMSITAKVLQLGVPVVTAFHVVRYVAVLTLTAPFYRWERGRRRSRGD